jgi:uncharacterized protein (DUF1800 family)
MSMNPLDSARFARQVGFGLAPDEATPDDPLAWAQAQLDKAPAVAFLADRKGTLMTGLPEGVRLVDSQKDATLAMQGHWDAEKNSFEQSRKLPRPEWEKLRYETVDLPYWRMAPWQEVLARGAMAVNGPAPVFERFWHFWTNHFTVAPATNNINAMVGPYMRMLRGHMSGHFRDMLFEAVTHPAMVLYLDNAISTGPKSRNSLNELRQNGKVKHSINENLGRELLELFTLSPAAGYSQADVMGATFILTGWGVHKPADTWNKSGAPYGSYFDFGRHEPGSHSVMGKSYSAFVRNDGKLNDLVDDLAAHPATAQHICLKLATAFIADEPAPEAVARLVKVFTQSKGHLPSLHKAVVAEVALAGAASRKFLLPECWLWSIYRVAGAELPVVPPLRELRGERLHDILTELGQPVHYCPQPNGWSLQSRDWISKEMLDRRVRYAFQFVNRVRQPGSLTQILLRQQGQGPLAQQLRAAAATAAGPERRGIWAAYLTSPDMLWS